MLDAGRAGDLEMLDRFFSQQGKSKSAAQAVSSQGRRQSMDQHKSVPLSSLNVMALMRVLFGA